MLLELFEGEYSVYRFNTEHQIDKDILEKDFLSLTKTKDELSIVTTSGSIEQYDTVENSGGLLWL